MPRRHEPRVGTRSVGLTVSFVMVSFVMVESGGLAACTGETSRQQGARTTSAAPLKPLGSTPAATAPAGGGTDASPGPRESATEQELGRLAGRAMPLDEYTVGANGPFQVALDAVTSICMSRLGFDYMPLASSSEPSVAAKYIDDLGLLGRPTDGSGEQNKTLPETQPAPGYLQALLGFDPTAGGERPENASGCADKAYAQLVGPNGAPDRDQLVTELWQQARAAIAWSRQWTVVVDPRLIPLALGVGAVIGGLGGLAPARRAARVDPATCLAGS